MDFAPEPVLDAFTPPPTRQAQRAAAPDDNGRTFDDHLDAVNEAPAERPAPTQAEAKQDAAPVEAKPAPDAESEAPEEAIDLDAALLGGPTPPAPPPMAAPVIVQIAVSQPQQQAQPQDADADIAPVTAPEAPPPSAPPMENEAAAQPADQTAQTAAKHGDTEVKPAAPDAPQQQAQQPAQAPQQAPIAPQQATAQPTAPIDPQQLPAAVQQAIAQTIAPAPQAVAQPNTRVSAKDAAKSAEITTDTNTREGKADSPAQNTNAKAQTPNAAASNVAIDAAAPLTQATSQGQDASQLAQTSAITTTASEASTHVQHAAADTGAQRTAPAAAQVGREIIRRFDGGNTNFELRLDPAELGRVEVRMEVTRDHRVTAVITADNPQALTELARHARELEQQLQSAGLQLSDNGLSFDLRQGGRGDQTDEANNGARGAAGEDATAEQQQAPVARPIGYERWRGVRVDMMV